MSDEVTPNDMPGAGAETEHSEPTPATEPGEEAPALKPTETVDYWKRMSRKNEQRAKDNEESARRWRETQEKAGGEDPLARIEALNAKFEAAEQARIRSDVARKTGVDPEDIRGATEDEMLESAERWNSRFNDRLDQALKSKSVPAAAPAAEVTSDKKVEGPKQLTADEYRALSPDQRKKARDGGQLDAFMRGEIR